MKLLLDGNLSRRIVPFLQACFPATSQVSSEARVGRNAPAVPPHAGSRGTG